MQRGIPNDIGWQNWVSPHSADYPAENNVLHWCVWSPGCQDKVYLDQTGRVFHDAMQKETDARIHRPRLEITRRICLEIERREVL